MGAARFRLGACLALALISLLVGSLPVGATTVAQTLPFTQNWSDTTLIATDNDWNGVPGVIGYRGDDLTTVTGTDPPTILADGSATPVNVIANQTSPNTLTTGGIAEFQIADPVVALNGSGTADAPHIVLSLDTTGLNNITVAYNLRDLDGSTDNAVQPVALQYRVGSSGAYTNVPAGFVADASSGPSLATLVVPVSAQLPAAANNQPLVQVRVITANAVGNDEWIGIDDISVTGTTADQAPSVSSTSPTNGAVNVPLAENVTINFSEPVNVAADWYGIFCTVSGAHTATVSGGPSSFTLDPNSNFAPSESCAVTIKADHVSDQDTDDPPDFMLTNATISFTTASPATGVVINEVDYDQPSTDAAEFLELKNVGGSVVNLGTLSVELVNGNAGGAAIYQTIPLPSISLAAGDYYVVCANTATVANCDLDVAPDTNLIQNGSPDAVALRSAGTLIDTVSYEGDTGAPYTEGSGVGLVDDGVAGADGIARCPDGSDTNQNNIDFKAVGITPGAENSCAVDDAPSVSTTDPAAGAAAVPVDSNVTINFSEPVDVTGSWFAISCTTSLSHTATVSGGPQSFTLDPDTDFVPSESCTVTVLAANVTDQDTIDPPDNMAADFGWSFATVSPPVAIHDIQGAAHTSPKLGQVVSNVNGIVTAKRSNGYWMQDPNPDADEATSEGIFVFTGSAPPVNVGDAVSVRGTVAEFRPGGASSANLTLTEIASSTTSVVSTGNPLPAATIVGSGGRVPPGEVIENDASGDVETGGVFDPAADGIDFYESLEGMRLQVNNPVVVGPRNSFGEIFVLADDGAGAAARTARGGIVIRDLGPEPPGDYVSGDFNPERIQLDDVAGLATPNANVGDHFAGPAVGVLDYDFGNFEIEVTAPLTRVADGVTREVTANPGANELTVATFNVENLDALEPQSKFDALAHEIVDNMRSPDVISLEEIQDNNGATNDSVVDADQTLAKLIAAIQAAGGPTYDYRQINPVDDQDGGEPGGNIRVGFIFRTDRGLAFVDSPGGGSTNGTSVVSGPGGPHLSFSPGRVDPTNPAWSSSRKPLAGEFTYNGQTFFLITNHFNSKGGDQPLFGHFQPPVRSSEVQRHQQAQIVNDFADSILAADTNANVIVLGDLNDFEFSQTVSVLEGGALHALMNTLPQNERYSYVFEGNSQSLDHIVVSDHLFGNPFTYDAVHVNAEFFDQLSDHDPQVARFVVTVPNAPPTVSAGGPYTVAEGGTVSLSASGTDPEGGPLTYAWDLDNNGSFETSGQTVTFSAAALDGPSTHTVRVQVTDNGGLTGTGTGTVSVTNVAPQATFSAPDSAFAGFPFTIALTGASDPSTADTAAGFTYAFDCGDGAGYGSFGSNSSKSCTALDVGAVTVRAKIQDKDGGVREYSATVQVVVTFDSLCRLVRLLVTSSDVADGLCDKLEAASRLTGAAKENQLQAFRNQIDAQTGKSIAPADAELLKRLSTRL